MKGNRIYIVSILVFLVIAFAIEYHMPKKFVWRATFSRHDYQPLGCAIFDDVVESTLWGDSVLGDSLNEYSVMSETFYQLSTDTVYGFGLLAIAEDLPLSQTDVDAILEMAERGDRIMLVASSFSKSLKDTLGLNHSYSFFRIDALKKYASSANSRDSLFWLKDSLYNERVFTPYPQFCQAYFYDVDSLFTTLVEKNHGNHSSASTAISKKVGKGEIMLVSTPLLFTNYGILDGDNADYIFRLLSRMKGMPVIRIEAYGIGAHEEESPFRYFLAQRPLRWGLYLTVIVLVLFMIFTSRRKQRVIPVVREPENKSIEFVELIGTLYYQKKVHRDLVRKKFIYFAETLRRIAQIDVEDESNDVELAHRMAQKTGLEEKKITHFLSRIRPVIQDDVDVTEILMKSCIEQMNEIINHLK